MLRRSIHLARFLFPTGSHGMSDGINFVSWDLLGTRGTSLDFPVGVPGGILLIQHGVSIAL